LTLVPTAKVAKDLHDIIIKYDDYKVFGVKSEGSIEICIDRPFTKVFGHEMYPGIFMKAAVLMHSFAGPFHPFIEGNKRTALLLTDLFLTINGYSFTFPIDVVDYLVFIARGKIKSIKRIAKWIRKACTKNELYGLQEDEILTICNGWSTSIFGDKFPLELRKI
jgi:death-on-curing protein